MPVHCLVCADSHTTDTCPKKKPRATLLHETVLGNEPDKSFIKSANCHGNHTANYKGCVARKSYLEIRQRFNRSNNPPRKPPPPSYNEMNYPNLYGPSLPPRINQQHVQQQQKWSDIVAEPLHQNDNMNQQMQLFSSMLTTVNNLIARLSSMVEVLMNALGKINSDSIKLT